MRCPNSHIYLRTKTWCRFNITWQMKCRYSCYHQVVHKSKRSGSKTEFVCVQVNHSLNRLYTEVEVNMRIWTLKTEHFIPKTMMMWVELWWIGHLLFSMLHLEVTSHMTRASAYMSVCLNDSKSLRLISASSTSGAMYRNVPTWKELQVLHTHIWHYQQLGIVLLKER